MEFPGGHIGVFVGSRSQKTADSCRGQKWFDGARLSSNLAYTEFHVRTTCAAWNLVFMPVGNKFLLK